MTYQIQVLPIATRAIKKLPPEAKRRVQAVVELLVSIRRLEHRHYCD